MPLTLYTKTNIDFLKTFLDVEMVVKEEPKHVGHIGIKMPFE